MSIIKKYRVKEKFALLKDLFHEFILVKKSIYVLGLSLFFSFLIIQTTVPQFYVSSTIGEAQLTSGGKQNFVVGGAAQAIFGQGMSDNGSYETFRSNMYSYALAQRMWEQGWGSKVFGSGDLNPEYFNAIPKNHKFSSKFAAFLLGYDLFKFYSAHDLQSYIKASFESKKPTGSQNIVVSSMTSNKDFAIEFMNALILETDKYAKESLIKKSKEIISATFDQLAISKNSSIASALADTINSEYFKIANLENDMPYNIYIIDPPHSSEYPVTPNIFAITFSNLLIFFLLSIIYSFIQKNKEDLW